MEWKVRDLSICFRNLEFAFHLREDHYWMTCVFALPVWQEETVLLLSMSRGQCPLLLAHSYCFLLTVKEALKVFSVVSYDPSPLGC